MIPRTSSSPWMRRYPQLGLSAQMLRISQRTVERYVKDQIKKPRSDRAARLETELKKRWQPQMRAKAREKALSTGGIVIDTRARLGYVAPIGSTDEDRIRHLTVAPPPRHPARLFEAQKQGASDDRLREIAAEALKETYFQDGGRRAASLEEVCFTDIEHLEFDL
ncbi:telomere-protecting terminal protein Tpg [Streptomyces sp. NPDC002596]